MITASLAAIAFVLPLSEWLLTFFIVVLLSLWIYYGGLQRIRSLSGNKRMVLVFIGLYLVYLVWMTNSSDFLYGLKELRLKLPLLIFPLVTGLSDPLNRNELKIILSSFIFGVMISSLYGTLTNLDLLFARIHDPAVLSPFISHIRLALMTVLAIAAAGWYFVNSENKKGLTLLYPVSIVWLTVYIFLLMSVTGILLLFVVLITTLFAFVIKDSSAGIKITAVVILTLLLCISGLLVRGEIKSFYTPTKSGDMSPMQFTLSGNRYWNDISRKDIENGNKVWINICEPELRKEWNLKSRISFDSTDRKGQILRYTLIRYMTSAGLTKDSAGFSSLTREDILHIEQGMTNREFATWPAVKIKIYEIIWQFDYYRNGGNPSGHSLTQRIEFMKTGWNVFLRLPVFGTGTGDIADEFRKQYVTDNSLLDREHRYLSHNQYLTFLASFGLTGFILVCFSLFLPLLKSGVFRQYLPVIFCIIIFLSMLWEDTLQTHTGVSFFAYFYSLFIFAVNGYEEDKKEK